MCNMISSYSGNPSPPCHYELREIAVHCRVNVGEVSYLNCAFSGSHPLMSFLFLVDLFWPRRFWSKFHLNQGNWYFTLSWHWKGTWTPCFRSVMSQNPVFYNVLENHLIRGCFPTALLLCGHQSLMLKTCLGSMVPLNEPWEMLWFRVSLPKNGPLCNSLEQWVSWINLLRF